MLGFDAPGFWTNFWPNFWADLAVAVIVGGVASIAVPFLLRHVWKKPEVSVFCKCIPNGTQFTLFVTLANTGKQSFSSEEIYFHLFIRGTLGVVPGSSGQIESDDMQKGETYKHLSGILRGPAFPAKHTSLFQVTLTSAPTKSDDVQYYLSTVHGAFPRAAFWSKKLPSGEVKLGDAVVSNGV